VREEWGLPFQWPSAEGQPLSRPYTPSGLLGTRQQLRAACEVGYSKCENCKCTLLLEVISIPAVKD